MTPPEKTLVVVNMAKWPTDFSDHRMYCCPAAENGFHASYRQYPAKYIGNYVSKGVKYIGVVEACVRLNKLGNDEVLWKFGEISDEDAIRKSNEVRSLTRRNPKPCLVMLQTELSATDFEYDYSGGFQSSRTYFDLSDLDFLDVKDLATELRSNPWSTIAKLDIS